jgi:histidinol-phosphatase (PHP family)
MPSFDLLDRYIVNGGKKVVLGSVAHISTDLALSFSLLEEKLPELLQIGYIKDRIFYSIHREPHNP